MGLFDWLFGKRQPPPGGPVQPPGGKPPRPKILSDPGDDSPWIVVDTGNGMTTVMDKEMFDYMYGESDAPDPAQRDLDALLPAVTRVRVLAGGMFRGRAMPSVPLVDTADPAALADLRRCLRIVEDPATFNHCGCLGGPTVELYVGGELAATVGLQHGQAIRWARWKHDARLVRGDDLSGWLTANGVDPTVLDLIFHNQYASGLGRPDGRPLSRGEQRLQVAEQKRRGGDLDGALADCEQVLRDEPGLGMAYAVRALVHAARGQPPACVADCTEAIACGFRHPEVYFARAVAHDQMGRAEEALADCDRALEIDPNHANARNSRGLICLRLGRPDEALADWSAAIRLAPEWPLPHVHRGQLRLQRGELDDAIADFDRALPLVGKPPPGPGQAPEGGLTPAVVLCLRAQAHYFRGDREQADADFRAAEERDPGTAHGMQGQFWAQQGRHEKAQECYTKAIKLRPQDPRGYLGRGDVHRALGDFPAAAADFTAALRLQPGNPMAHLSRSYARGQLGEYGDALADLEAALALAPDQPMVCNNLAWLLATCPDDAVRDGPRAVGLARRACEVTQWQRPFCVGTLAAACAEVGDFDQAVRYQTVALESYPDSEKPAGRRRLEMYRQGTPYRD